MYGQRIGTGANRIGEYATRQILSEDLKRPVPGVVLQATGCQLIGWKALKLTHNVELQLMSDELLIGQVATD